MSTQSRKVVSVIVKGKVQGVWFRAWTKKEAEALGLSGWVRNEPDGSVCAMISGSPQAVDAMVERLWEGPPAASVTAVETVEASGEPDLSGFSIRR